MADLFQLCYVSKSLIDSDPAILLVELERIISAAAANNRRLDVTGALLYSGGYFSQVLEGEADCLEALFHSIQSDSRHVDCKITEFSPIDARRFSTWSMLLAGVEGSPRPEIDSVFYSAASMNLDAAGSNTIHDMLADLVVRQGLGNQGLHPKAG